MLIVGPFCTVLGLLLMHHSAIRKGLVFEKIQDLLVQRLKVVNNTNQQRNKCNRVNALKLQVLSWF